MIDVIISGGQTGVDISALKVAIELDISYGGWCPKERIDENGIIPHQYVNLKEISGDFKSDADNYATRTILNIRDSDGTLILVPNIPLPANIKDGTILTQATAKDSKKPHLLVNLSGDLKKNIALISSWIEENKIKVLNIAGPRESSSPGIHDASFNLLREVMLYMRAQQKSTTKKRLSSL